MFEAWKRSLDATIEVPDCEPAINAPRGKRERRTTPPCASVHEGCEGGGGCGVVRKKEEETWRGRGGGGKGWLCLAVKAREGGGSPPPPRGIRRKLAYRAGSPYPYFTSRGGGREKG